MGIYSLPYLYDVFFTKSNPIWTLDPSERLITFHPVGVTLMVYTIVYEVANTFADIFTKGELSFLTLAHHTAVIWVGYYALTEPFAQPYGTFYCGAPHLSTAFIPRNWKGFVSKNLEIFIKAMFAIVFIGTRCFIWTYVNAYFWSDAISYINDNGTSMANSMYLGANVALTGMQYYWGYKILRIMCSMLKRKSGKTKQNEG